MKLDAMDIPSFIADECTINVMWLFSDAIVVSAAHLPAWNPLFGFSGAVRKIMTAPPE